MDDWQRREYGDMRERLARLEAASEAHSRRIDDANRKAEAADARANTLTMWLLTALLAVIGILAGVILYMADK